MPFSCNGFYKLHYTFTSCVLQYFIRTKLTFVRTHKKAAPQLAELHKGDNIMKKEKRITSQRQLNQAMRQMIRRVANGEKALPENPTNLDREIAAECISRGYLYQSPRKNGREVHRDLFGIVYSEIDNSIVPLEGLAFLRPDKSTARSWAALIISALALLVSILSNLSDILEGIRSLVIR